MPDLVLDLVLMYCEVGGLTPTWGRSGARFRPFVCEAVGAINASPERNHSIPAATRGLDTPVSYLHRGNPRSFSLPGLPRSWFVRLQTDKNITAIAQAPIFKAPTPKTGVLLTRRQGY